MTAPPAPAARPAAVADLWDRVIGLVEDLDTSDWARPTPCADWDVRDLVAHLAAVQTQFDGSAPQPSPPEGWAPPEHASAQEVWTATGVAARRGWPIERLLDELRTARDGHVARLEAVTDWEAETVGPVGSTTEEGLLTIRCFDIWVHVQDLREAFGLAPEAGDPSGGAQLGYAWVHRLVPWMHAKRVDAPRGSALRFTLRDPYLVDSVLRRGEDGRVVWDDTADPGRCRVEADPAAFTLLVSGRGTPERWRDAGLLDWAGPRGEAFVAGARLF